MGLRVGTNTQSIAAQRHLGASNAAQKASMEKLASGSRIVRAADDAAGLAISEKMRADIRSLRQATRNANDGISLIQTAEGSMNEMQNILIRFRELSIQGASDTIGDTERQFIDKEVQQLKGEVDRIAQSTEYNGRKLLTGEGESLDVQVGLKNDPMADRFSFDVQAIKSTVEALGLGDVSTISKESSRNNLDVVDSAISKLAQNRSEMGALQNRLQSTVNNNQVYDENLSAARSRIYDIDMASETAELTKQSILTQAGTSVLSQANQSPSLALKLI